MGWLVFAAAMKILSVVGNRPQFIKSAPLSLALRNKVDEVVLHTGQHYDRELSQIFFEELELGEPGLPARGRLGDACGADGPHAARHRAGDPGGGSRRCPRLRGHQLDARRRSRGGQAGRPGGARRGRASLVRPSDARGAEPDPGRPPLGAPLLPQRRRGRESAAGGDHRRCPPGRRRDDGRERSARTARARSLERARRCGRRARLVPPAHAPPGGQRASRCGFARVVAALEQVGEPVVFPAHPRTRAALEQARHRPSRVGRASCPLPGTSTSLRSPRRPASS